MQTGDKKKKKKDQKGHNLAERKKKKVRSVELSFFPNANFLKKKRF